MRRIGLDLDNTIIDYDEAFVRAARRRGLVPEGFAGGKTQVRDAVRAGRDDGEQTWQRLQGQVYGRGLAEARLADGCDPFLRRCREREVAVVIVSHKTRFGHHDEERLDLHAAARAWLAARPGLAALDVYFEPTRRDKVARIRALGCEVFVDDLAEVFEESTFPGGVRQILLGPSRRPGVPWTACATWDEVGRALFDA